MPKHIVKHIVLIPVALFLCCAPEAALADSFLQLRIAPKAASLPRIDDKRKFRIAA
jgi:hypothetical protein